MFGFKIVRRSKIDKAELATLKMTLNWICSLSIEILQLGSGSSKEVADDIYDGPGVRDFIAKAPLLVSNLKCLIERYSVNKFSLISTDIKLADLYGKMKDISSVLDRLRYEMYTNDEEMHEFLKSALDLILTQNTLLKLIVEYDLIRINTDADIIGEYYRNIHRFNILEKKLSVIYDNKGLKKQIKEFKEEVKNGKH